MKKVGKEEKYIKRSVVLHPVVYDYAQKLRTIALDKGVDISFSASINAMVLGHVLTVAYGLKEGLKLMWDFILDKKTIEEINTEDLKEQWKEEMRKKLAKILE